MMKPCLERTVLTEIMLVDIKPIDEQHHFLVALFNNLIDRLDRRAFGTYGGAPGS